MNYPHRLHNMEDIRDTLTDRQKEVLEEILQAKKEEGREETKAALRSTVAGSRKPEAFNPAVETLAQYLKRWKPFSKAMGPKRYIIDHYTGHIFRHGDPENHRRQNVRFFTKLERV